MTWIEKGQPTPFDHQSIEGLLFIDGDQMAREAGSGWTKSKKYPVIVFPSNVECDLLPATNPDTIGLVNIFGEMDLPYRATCEVALIYAKRIIWEMGYVARRVSEDSLELQGHEPDEHFKVVYDKETHRMVNVIPLIEQRHISLLDEETREKLPKLRTHEGSLEAHALLKFFLPDSKWTWYASEGSEIEANRYRNTPPGERDFLMFGFVFGDGVEFGYFSLRELEKIRGPLGLFVERDPFFEPKSLKELRDMHGDL